MALPALNVSTILKEVECNNCSMLFAIPSGFMDERRNDHKTWYCPSGHHLWYPGDSAEEKLRKENEKLQKRLNWKQHEVNHITSSLRATRGVVTKLKKRVESGTCIHCHRFFKNVNKHMEGKHKDICQT